MSESKIANDDEFSYILNHHHTWLQVEKVFSTPLSTIFLFQIDSALRNAFIPVANWLYGNQVKAGKRFQCDYKQLKDKETVLELPEGQNVYILEDKKCRIVALDLSWLIDAQIQIKTKINRLLSLKLLDYFSTKWTVPPKHKTTKIYCALKGQNQQKINRFRDVFKQTNFGVILCGDQEDNPNPNINQLTMQGHTTSSCPFSCEQLLKDVQLSSHSLKEIFIVDFWNQSKDRGINLLTNQSDLNDKSIYYMVDPVRKLIMRLSSRDQELGIQESYNQISRAIRRAEIETQEPNIIFRPQVEKFTKFLNRNRNSADNLQFRYFHLFLNLEKDFKQLLKANRSETSRLMNTFLFEVLLKLSQLPTGLTSQQISTMFSIGCTLLKENELINQILLANRFSFVGHTISNLEDLWGKIFAGRAGVLEKIININILSKQDAAYYEQLKQLADRFYNPDNYVSDVQARKQAELENFELKLDWKKAESLLKDKKGSIKQNVVKGVQSLFGIWQKRERAQDFREINFPAILLDCANSLRKIDQPDIALKLYKQLGNIYKAEECIQEILDLDLCNNASQLYMEISKYYRSCNYLEMSRKYAQKAQEENMRVKYEITDGKAIFSEDDYDQEPSDFVMTIRSDLRRLEESIRNNPGEGDELKISFSPMERLPKLLAMMGRAQ